jgi:hypothetical protein
MIFRGNAVRQPSGSSQARLADSHLASMAKDPGDKSENLMKIETLSDFT